MKRPFNFDLIRKNHIAAHLLSFLVIVLIAVATISPKTKATGNYSASDALGQVSTSVSSYALTYTQNTANSRLFVGPVGLSIPRGQAIDLTNHRLFVVDTGNQRVLEFDLDSNNIPLDGVADHVLGQPDFTTTTLSTNQNKFTNPISLAYDDVTQLLFVGDSGNNRVLVFNVSSISDGENAVNVIGQPDFVTANINVPTQTTFGGISSGIAVDSTRHLLYVGDAPFGSAYGRILVFDIRTSGSGAQSLCGTNTTGIADGMPASCVIGEDNFNTADGGLTQSKLSMPTALALDTVRGLLFEGDSYNRRVMVFDVRPEGSGSQSLCGTTTTGIAIGMNASCVLGQANFTSNSFTVNQNRTGFVTGLAYDSGTQQLFVYDTDNRRVLVFDVRPELSSGQSLCGVDTSGILNFMNASCVLGQSNFTSSAAATTQSRFGSGSPNGLVIDGGNHLLYVVDNGNNRIMVFDVNSSTITNDENATSEIGQYIVSYNFGSSPVFTQHDINDVGQPIANAVGFANPNAAAVDSVHHRIFVVDGNNNRVLVFNADVSDHPIDYVADHVIGQPDYESVAVALNDHSFSHPSGIVYDATNDRLFVSDMNHARVMIFNTSVISDNMSAALVLGQADFSSLDQSSTQSTLVSAAGLAYDPTHKRLFVADPYSCRVMVFDVAVGTITSGEPASNVLGEPDFFSGNCSPSQTGLGTSFGVAYDDANNRLFVADSDGSRILVFDASTITDGAPAVNVLGHMDFTDTSTGTTKSTFTNPNWLAYDSSGDTLFVGDTGNSRVLGFDVTTIADGQDAKSVIGQSDYSTANSSPVDRNSLAASQGGSFGDTNRILFTADTSNYRVMMYNLPSLNSVSFPGVIQDNAYSAPILTSNIQGTLSFQILSGSLPTGLSIVGTNIVGTPTVAGTYNFILRAIDSPADANDFYSNKVSYSITVGDPITGGTGGSGGPAWNICSDTLDNDGDGFADILDPGCHSDGNPANPATYVPGDNDETDVIIPPPTDFCPNIAGNQASIPAGMIIDGSGNCVSPPADFCPNIAGVQATIPAGMIVDISGNCVTPPPPPTDVCPNIAGAQASIPAGMFINPFGDCQPLPDMCPNIAGNQASIPAGMVINGSGNCVTPPPPTDVCPNIAGNQASVPAGMSINSFGDCVAVPPPTDLCPNIAGNQASVPAGMSIDISGNCVTPPPPTDLCPNIAGSQSIVPIGLIIDDSGNCTVPPPPPTDICPNIAGTQVSIPAGMIIDSIGNCVSDVIIPPTGGGGPTGGVLAALIATIGLVVGGIGTLLSSFFLNPLSFGEIILLPERIWSLILIAFGFKKRARPWGVVYDAVTKQPLDPAVVALFDKEGNEIGTCITDLDGRYGFIVDPGIYQLIAKKTNYEFPAHSLAGHASDELYEDLYFGGFFEVKEKGEVVKKNIPMDPLKFDWNEYTKKKRKLTKFYTKNSVLWSKIADVLFIVGFSSSIIAVIISPFWYNILIFALYILLLALRQVHIKPRSGQVIEKSTGAPLGFGIMRVYRASMRQEVMARALTTDGRYYALVPNGKYYVIIDRKNDDKSYKHMFQSEVFDVRNGIINQEFSV